MASHGGMREGSGRPAGAVNKATSGLKLNLSELAREYTNNALDTLVEVMQSSPRAIQLELLLLLRYLIGVMVGQQKPRRLKLTHRSCLQKFV